MLQKPEILNQPVYYFYQYKNATDKELIAWNKLTYNIYKKIYSQYPNAVNIFGSRIHLNKTRVTKYLSTLNNSESGLITTYNHLVPKQEMIHVMAICDFYSEFISDVTDDNQEQRITDVGGYCQSINNPITIIKPVCKLCPPTVSHCLCPKHPRLIMPNIANKIVSLNNS